MGELSPLMLRALRRLAAGDVVDIFRGTEFAAALGQRWWPRGAKGGTLRALVERRLICVRRWAGVTNYQLTSAGADVISGAKESEGM